MGILSVLLLFSICQLLAAHSLVQPNIQLANNAVLSMYQDEDGYMWIGTYDGLHAYNGKDTEVYRMELDNDRSLCSNIVVRIIPAGEDHIWVSTSMGLNLFSLRERCVSGTFMQYREVYKLASDSDGNTLLASRDGYLSLYVPSCGRFTDIPFPDVQAADVIMLWSDSPGHFRMLSRDGTVTEYSVFRDAVSSGLAELMPVSEIRVSERPVRAAACSGDMIYYVDDSAVLRGYDLSSGKGKSISDLSEMGEGGFSVSEICLYDDYLYLGFYAGALVRVPVSGGRGESLMSDYRVFCLMKDRRQDILWIGTDGYGVYMYCEKDNPFQDILMTDLPLTVRKPVRGLYTDDTGALWIGTKGDGIIRINDYERHGMDGNVPESAVRHFTTSEGLSSNEVFSFCRSGDGDILWIGTSGSGLSCYSYRDGVIHSVDAGLEGHAVHQMCAVDSATLYLATDGEGLVELRYHVVDGLPVVDHTEHYRFNLRNVECNAFYALDRDTDSTLLVGLKSGYGLVRFNIRDRSYDFLDMSALQSRALGDILSLCGTADSGIFCGSSAGLICLETDGGIRKYGRNDGLVNDMVHGVLPEGDGSVWLSTNKGLVQCSPHNGVFHSFSSNELAVIEFCDDSYWKCPDTGRLFFGGVNGVVWIDSSRLPSDDYRPDLIFEEMTFPDGDRLSLAGLRDGDNAVVLPCSSTRFTVSFVAVDYLNGENYEYSYRLEGAQDENWVELQKSNSIHFSNLLPGHYVLHVRYRSSVLDDSEREYQLPFTIRPPWYLSTAAVIAYILVSAAVSIITVCLVRRHYRLKQKQAVLRAEEENRKKLDEARMNFFVNISHELCTPLTLINGIAEYLGTSLGDDSRYAKPVSILSSNVRGLSELVEEILDFRKIEEEGFGKLDIRRLDLYPFVSGLMDSFGEMASRNRIGLELVCPCGHSLEWNTDRSFFKKIVLNLLSNAVKYTPEGGSVTVGMSVEESKLVMKVRNTGAGLTEEQLSAIFDRYRMFDNMDRNMYSGSMPRHGLGMFICRALVRGLGGDMTVHSVLGEYTEFTVVLPHLDENADIVRDEVPVSAPEVAGHGMSRGDDGGDRHSGQMPSVLVVDDNRDIRWLISESLSDRFRVIQCGSVQEAESVLSTLTPDLIITDVIMSGMDDGFSFVKSLRQDRYRKGIPVIVCSARVSDNDKVEGMESGADAYLTKPFSVSVLHAMADRLVSNRRMLKDFFGTPESARTIVNSHLVHSSEKDFLDSVIEVLQKHLSDEDFSMDILAEASGLSSRNFYRRFKKVSGKTPSEFIKDYRFEYAAILLRNSSLTVQEVMYKVGITNKSYFYREFSSRYGTTPKDYRNNVSAGM